MKVCEYSRSRLFLDLGPRSFTYEHLKLTFLRNHRAILTNFIYASGNMEMIMFQYDVGHMTKMAVMPIYGKNTYNSSSLEQVDGFP